MLLLLYTFIHIPPNLFAPIWKCVCCCVGGGIVIGWHVF